MDDFKSQIGAHGALVGKGLVVLLFSASLLLLGQLLGEIKSWKFVGQGVEFRNTITVTGTGEVTAVPDIAEFSFAVIKESKSVEDAQGMVTEKMNAALKLLGDSGVAKKDITTTSYNISPRYEYRESEKGSFPPGGERVLVGYEASHWVNVKVRSIDRAGEILGKIGEMGIDNVSGLNFSIEKEEELKREARRLAVAAAEEKAQAIADDFGVRIIKVVAFNESDSPAYFKDYGGLEMVRSSAATPEIPTGESSIKLNVSVTYAID